MPSLARPVQRTGAEWARVANSVSTMKIAVVDPQRERADVIQAGLRDADYRDIHHISEMPGLLERLSELAPDVILIDLENPDRDVLE